MEDIMQQIQLFRTNSGWHARFLNDPDMPRLFGTNTIPTAFTKYADESDVVRAIQSLNPGAVIEVLR
jgi:hypothetical protein